MFSATICRGFLAKINAASRVGSVRESARAQCSDGSSYKVRSGSDGLCVTLVVTVHEAFSCLVFLLLFIQNQPW